MISGEVLGTVIGTPNRSEVIVVMAVGAGRSGLAKFQRENEMNTESEFREGDQVVLAKGSYQGTPGVFLRLKEDPKWADITERDGSVRSHPVEWLAHVAVGS